MFPPINELEGHFVTLRPLHPDDVSEIKRLTRDERIWEYTKTLVINEFFDEQFDKYIAAAFNDAQQSFVITKKGEETIIGMSRFYNYEPADKRIAIGYTWYVPDVWGKIYNKDCKYLLLRYAFEVLEMRRVEFHVAHKNLRSQKAVEKIGGVREGVLRKHSMMNDGSIRNTVMFSIVDDEWPQVSSSLLKLINDEISII